MSATREYKIQMVYLLEDVICERSLRKVFFDDSGSVSVVGEVSGLGIITVVTD